MAVLAVVKMDVTFIAHQAVMDVLVVVVDAPVVLVVQ